MIFEMLYIINYAMVPSAEEVCRDCTDECNTALFSPVFTQTKLAQCLQIGFGSQQYAFSSNSSIPVLGDTVYANTNCSVDVYPPQDFRSHGSATANPKTGWR